MTLRRGRLLSGESGLSLIEIIAYVAIISVVFNLAAQVFISGMRLSTLSTLAVDKVSAVEGLREAFSESAREAYAVAEGVGSYRTGENQIVLSLPGGDGVERFVIFGDLRGVGRLNKMLMTKRGEELSSDSFVTYRGKVESLRFSFDGPDMAQARLVTMEVRLESGGGVRREGPVRVCTASLRGIGR